MKSMDQMEMNKPKSRGREQVSEHQVMIGNSFKLDQNTEKNVRLRARDSTDEVSVTSTPSSLGPENIAAIKFSMRTSRARAVRVTIDYFELWQQGDLENPLHTQTLARSHL
jgi:hypothetical protein